MSSTMSSPFAGLSRRSRYEALVSKYEAAAEVVRTHADTDVQLQPQDQPIAEEEPQQLAQLSTEPAAAAAREGEIQVDIYPAASRGGRPSVGGLPGLTPMSPGGLFRRGSATAGSVVSGGGASITGLSGEDGRSPLLSAGSGGDGGTTAAGAERGALSDRGEEEDGEERRRGQEPGGGAGGGLAAGLSGAFSGLASLAGLHLGAGGASAGEAAADASSSSPAEGGLEPSDGLLPPGGRSHRKHRSEKPKKAMLAGTNWLKVDYRGLDTVIRVDKHKLMHKLGVQARDLRLLDLTSVTPPAILGRDKAIIVNLWHIKAIITLDYCLVVSPDAISDKHEREAAEAFVADLKAKLSTDRKARSYVGLTTATAVSGAPGAANGGYGSLQLPFELKVLEVCLDKIAAQLDWATKVLECDAYPNLDALTREVTAVNLEKARRIKNRLVRLTKNVESVREVLERFLNDDGDMHRLHLTGAELSRQVSMRPAELGRLSAGLLPASSASIASSDSSSDSSIDEAETAAVEMLLEAYFIQIDHTFNRLQTVDEYIKDTEDLVTIQLDQHRNQLITIDLLLTSLNTCLSLMTVVGGYFGMNLNSNLQETPHLFKAVVLTTTLVSLALFAAFVGFLYRQELLYF